MTLKQLTTILLSALLLVPAGVHAGQGMGPGPGLPVVAGASYAFYFDCNSKSATQPNIGSSTYFNIDSTAVEVTPGWAVGGALDLSATDTRLNFDAADFTLNNFYIEYKFSPNNSNTMYMFSGNGTNYLYVRYKTDGTGYMNFGGNQTYISSGPTLSIGTGYTGKVTVVGNVATWYINGASVGTVTNSGTWSGATIFNLGGINSWDNAEFTVDEIYGGVNP